MMPRRAAVPASAETPSGHETVASTFSSDPSGSFYSPLIIIDDDDDVKVVHRETNATTDGQVYFQVPGPIAGNPEPGTSQIQQADPELLQQEAVTAMIAANDHHHLCTIPTVQSDNTHLITSQAFPTVQMFPTVMVPHLMVPMSRIRSAILSTVTPTLLFDAVNCCEPIAVISSVIEPNHQHYESHRICRQMGFCNAAIQPSLQGSIPDHRFLHGVQPQNYDAQRPELGMMTIESRGLLPQLSAGLAIFEQNIPHRRNSISEPRYDRNIHLVEVARNHAPFHLEQNELTNNVERASFLPYRTRSRYENNLMLPNIVSEERCDLNASLGGVFPQYFDFRRIEQNELMDSSMPLNQQHYRAKPPYNQMRTFPSSLHNIVPQERHDRYISFRLPQEPQLYSSQHPESNVMRNSENLPVARNLTSQNFISDYNHIRSCPIVRPPTRYNVPHHPTPNVMRNMMPLRYANSLNHQHCGSYQRLEQTYSYNPTFQNNALVQKNGRVTLPAQAVDSYYNQPQTVMGNNVQREQRYQDMQRCGASGRRANLSLQPSNQHTLQVEQRGLSATLGDHLPQHCVAEQTPPSCATNSGNIPQASSDHRFGQTMAHLQQQIRKEPRVRTTPAGRRQSKIVPVLPNANQLPVYPVTHNISLVIHPPAPAVGTQPEQQQPPSVAAISISSNQVPQQTPTTTSNVQYGHLFANSLVHHIKVPAASVSQPVNEPTILIPQLSVANNVSQPVDMSTLVPDTHRQQIITPTTPLATATSANSNSGQQISNESSAGGSSKLTSRNKNSAASKLPKVEDLANDKEAPPVKVRKMGQICPPGGYFLERSNQLGSHAAAVADATAANTRRISTAEPNRTENATLTSAMATSSAQNAFCSSRSNEQRVVDTLTNTLRRKNRSSTSLENEGATSVHSVKSRRRSGYPDSSSNN
ncbi:uncharacterized protein isoform X3 [Rhodnius prolixus]|uniref:uncharacterized protein isoform X3 n=1 Tax=Rhodnius prolixus TaxID=13249 RepID=UPI003D188204